MKKSPLSLLLALSLSLVAGAADQPKFADHMTQRSDDLLNVIRLKPSKNDFLINTDFQACHNQCVFEFVLCQRAPNANPFDCSKAYKGCYEQCVNTHL